MTRQHDLHAFFRIADKTIQFSLYLIGVITTIIIIISSIFILSLVGAVKEWPKESFIRLNNEQYYEWVRQVWEGSMNFSITIMFITLALLIAHLTIKRSFTSKSKPQESQNNEQEQ